MNFILLFFLLVLSAFFSAIETATLSLSKGKVRSFMEQNKKGSKTLYHLKQNSHRLLITLLIGNNLVNVAAAAIATQVSLNLFGNSGVSIATGITTLLILVFGEITPKSFALQNAGTLSLVFAKPMQILEFIFSPAIVVFEGITKMVNKVSGERSSRLTEEELRSLFLISREEGLLDKEATKRLQSVLDFERTTVRSIMTPKAEVISFAASLTIEKFLDSPLDSPFDRYPLYQNDPNNIVGVVDVIDVIRTLKEEKLSTKLSEIMRPTFFVKQEARLDSLLPEFRSKQTSMGVVVDENKTMVGIFTSQDIVEEIVGDIFEQEIYYSQKKE